MIRVPNNTSLQKKGGARYRRLFDVEEKEGGSGDGCQQRSD